METFSALLAFCAGNSPVPGEFPSQKPVTRSFDVFFDLRLNKPLRKQSWGWWFETPSRSLWCHCNGNHGKYQQAKTVYIVSGMYCSMLWHTDFDLKTFIWGCLQYKQQHCYTNNKDMEYKYCHESHVPCAANARAFQITHNIFVMQEPSKLHTQFWYV